MMDGHPLALSWLGSVRGQRVVPLGIESFGQSGGIPDLYRAYRIDSAAIIDAVARAIITIWAPALVRLIRMAGIDFRHSCFLPTPKGWCSLPAGGGWVRGVEGLPRLL